MTRRPAEHYVYRPQDHEPLDAEGLAWLADQLCSDMRVHPDRTMASGWITTQAAYEYPALLDILATTRADLAALKAREVGYVQAMDAMGEELASRDALIHQLGENAAKAAGEYAEDVERLREALEYIRDELMSGAACRSVAMEALDGPTARAAPTEPTDG